MKIIAGVLLLVTAGYFVYTSYFKAGVSVEQFEATHEELRKELDSLKKSQEVLQLNQDTMKTNQDLFRKDMAVMTANQDSIKKGQQVIYEHISNPSKQGGGYIDNLIKFFE